jgi:glycolate oxidase iron-sulfur subunit
MAVDPRAVGVVDRALEAQHERLMPCVHCGFCLPACPTYNRLGDEADSPRGRLHLMRAVVDGRMSPASDAFRRHIDRCLGCRACEPVCPSGVEYGTLLELARDVARRSRPPALSTRLMLAVFSSRLWRGLFFLGGRLLRGAGLAALGTRVLPSGGLPGSARFGLAMLAATRTWSASRRWPGGESGTTSNAGDVRSAGTDPDGAGGSPPPSFATGADAASRATSRLRVGMLTGCVQEGLYSRVNAATRRVLEANGYEVVEVRGQECCGALHAHGGDLEEARRLARANVVSFEAAHVDLVVVNAAGCGAAMKEYGTWLSDDAENDMAARAAALARKTRDVSELLSEAGPRRGAPLRGVVAYDHPCHLLHAQRLEQPPLSVLAAVPELQVRVVEGASECCGGAGIYGLTHPDLGGRIGGDKVRSVLAASADVVATPNPGCMMQIGAGLRLAGADLGVAHPVELLDESYRRAGYYARDPSGSREPRPSGGS